MGKKDRSIDCFGNYEPGLLGEHIGYDNKSFCNKGAWIKTWMMTFFPFEVMGLCVHLCMV